MSSASQIDHATLWSIRACQLLSNMDFPQETEALRARLPAQLAPFTSNISIIQPIQTIRTSPSDGVHCCSCGVKERRISMSVVVVPSPHSQSQDSVRPYMKILELIWQDWWTSMKNAKSHMYSISLQYYGPPRHGMYSKAKAFVGWFNEGNGVPKSVCSHGGIKSVVEEVVRDMGFREGELDDKLEVIEALLGNEGAELLKSATYPRTDVQRDPSETFWLPYSDMSDMQHHDKSEPMSLRDIIEVGLEVE